jgi:hypothetical protein
LRNGEEPNFETKTGDRKCTRLFLYRGHGKMTMLTAKLFHQCPTLSAIKGQCLSLVQAVTWLSLLILVWSEWVDHIRGNVRESHGWESITLPAMQGGSINWTSVRGRSVVFVPCDWLS